MRTALALFLALAVARADDLYGKSGSTPIARGVMVVEETSEKVYYLDKRLRRRSYPKSVVGRVEKKRCEVHEYSERSDAATDADAVMALAGWAAAKKFHKDVVHALHERALGLDGEHEAANLALGRVKHGGVWMTPAERDAGIASANDAEMRAKGLVPYKGKWVTPGDKDKLEAGLQKYDGRWMTEDEVKTEQGYVRHEGKWVKKDELEVVKLMGHARTDTGLGERLALFQTDHFAVMGDLAPEKLKILAETMERTFGEFVRIFPDAAKSDILAGKHRMFAFRKNRPYQKLVRNRYKRQKKSEQWSARFAQEEEARMKLRLRETSFWEFQPVAFSAHVQMPDPFEGLKSHCVHFGGNILITRHIRQRFPTWWLSEGIAYYLEKKVTGGIQTFNADVGGGGYANQGPLDSSQANPWLDGNKWPDMLLKLVRQGRDPKLAKIKGKVLYGKKNRLTAQDLAKAVSVVSYLATDNTKKFAAFVRDAKTGPGGNAVEREVSAVIKHYGSYTKIEQGWKSYALNGFRVNR